MFTIYKPINQSVPKAGEIIKFKGGNLIILKVVSKGIFWVNGEESYKLTVKTIQINEEKNE